MNLYFQEYMKFIELLMTSFAYYTLKKNSNSNLPIYWSTDSMTKEIKMNEEKTNK